MQIQEFLRRHFSRMGARVQIQNAGLRPGTKIRIDVARDRRVPQVSSFGDPGHHEPQAAAGNSDLTYSP